MAASLARVVGLPGAIFLGLGSIVGTGIFVSIGVAAGIAGSGVVLAVALAALLAVCNGLSSAQLAAAHPVSGGTYEYGYRYLTPTLGFVAGWTFLCAKSASAATAALGLGGYVLAMVARDDHVLQIVLGVAATLAITALVAGGIRRTNRTNALIVSITLVALVAFVIAGIPRVRPGELGGVTDTSVRDLLHATALAFVAITGYGRIATLGEEVHDPARTIPRAILATLAATLVLYVAVTVIAIGTVGSAGLASATAPLETIAATFGVPAIRIVVAVAAITAMLGVLLNLVLGVSRVVLAMARRGDLPAPLARIDERSSPRIAVMVTGVVIAVLVAIGSVRTTWSFSAFTVLVYYALTNLAALRLPAADRRFPRVLAVIGLAGCIGLAVWVEPAVWLAGLVVIAVGLGVRHARAFVRK